MCVLLALPPNHLSGQTDPEVPYSDLVPSVQLLPFPWILQTLVKICECMCLIRASKLFRFQTCLVLQRLWPFADFGAICNITFLSLNIHEPFEEKKNPRIKPIDFAAGQAAMPIGKHGVCVYNHGGLPLL